MPGVDAVLMLPGEQLPHCRLDKVCEGMRPLRDGPVFPRRGTWWLSHPVGQSAGNHRLAGAAAFRLFIRLRPGLDLRLGFRGVPVVNHNLDFRPRCSRMVPRQLVGNLVEVRLVMGRSLLGLFAGGGEILR